MRFKNWLDTTEIKDPMGRNVKFVNPNDSGFMTVIIDPKKLIPNWKKSNYVEPGHPNEIGTRINDFGTWYDRNSEPIRMPTVYFPIADSARKKYNKDPQYANIVNQVEFSDGRHRFAWMVQQGFTQIPVAVPVKQAANFKQLFQP